MAGTRGCTHTSSLIPAGTVTELPALGCVLELPVPWTLRIQPSVSLQKVSPSPIYYREASSPAALKPSAANISR